MPSSPLGGFRARPCRLIAELAHGVRLPSPPRLVGSNIEHPCLLIPITVASRQALRVQNRKLFVPKLALLLFPPRLQPFPSSCPLQSPVHLRRRQRDVTSYSAVPSPDARLVQATGARAARPCARLRRRRREKQPITPLSAHLAANCAVRGLDPARADSDAWEN